MALRCQSWTGIMVCGSSIWGSGWLKDRSKWPSGQGAPYQAKVAQAYPLVTSPHPSTILPHPQIHIQQIPPIFVVA